ncbi:LysR family transcriptional regulator [Pseudomonas syringae group sp. J309-1]|uniref:LysR family transcriptional regulator n=1 Tax=Pseudomonas syringae group sp. J309-1 TaxID=3079588 RepID=UPI0029105205|nr:LysR family transcriptional regulator [Pseudomonas syringae group sp. J309-1]MDU8357614.1 LysR family transcriptional regulator [Pseudomonas syringae group sp. J309-1]
MNLKFLETFVWVARLKSFRLTAEKMFTTQASISNRIAALEDELGAKLFLRDSKRVSLTPEGERVLNYAEQMIDTMHALQQSISATSDLKGCMRLGVMDTVIHTWLSPFISTLMECYPAVEIELTVDTSLNLCDQLQKGYLDLIVQTDMVRSDAVRNQHLAVLPVEWIVQAGSIYQRSYASIDELAAERIITFSRNSRPHQDILNLLHAGGVDSPRISCVNSVAAMTLLVSDGFGIGALPAALVSKELAEGKLFILENVTRPQPLDIIACWRAGVGLELTEQVVSIARHALEQYARQMGPEMVVLSVSGAQV